MTLNRWIELLNRFLCLLWILYLPVNQHSNQYNNTKRTTMRITPNDTKKIEWHNSNLDRNVEGFCKIYTTRHKSCALSYRSKLKFAEFCIILQMFGEIGQKFATTLPLRSPCPAWAPGPSGWWARSARGGARRKRRPQQWGRLRKSKYENVRKIENKIWKK